MSSNILFILNPKKNFVTYHYFCLNFTFLQWV